MTDADGITTTPQPVHRNEAIKVRRKQLVLATGTATSAADTIIVSTTHVPVNRGESRYSQHTTLEHIESARVTIETGNQAQGRFYRAFSHMREPVRRFSRLRRDITRFFCESSTQRENERVRFTKRDACEESFLKIFRFVRCPFNFHDNFCSDRNGAQAAFLL